MHYEDDHRMQAEMRLVEQEEMRLWGRLAHRTERVFIRLIRIACGTALLGFCFWAGGQAWDTLSKPFAAQSFIGLVGGIFLAWLAFFLFMSAFACAFGEGPTPAERVEKRRQEASARLAARGNQTLVEARHQPPKAWLYYVGWVWGKLKARR